MHNLGSGGSDSPDGDVFKSDADPTLTFVLPTTLSAPAQTVRPHYHLPCLQPHKVLGNFLRKISPHVLELKPKAQITGPHTPRSSSANVWHPSSFPVGASQVCQIFSQMYYTFFCSSNYQLEQYYQNHLSSIHKDALNFLEKFCCVIFRLSVMSMRHDIRYKCPLSICFCGSSCVLSVRVSRHPFV